MHKTQDNPPRLYSGITCSKTILRLNVLSEERAGLALLCRLQLASASTAPLGPQKDHYAAYETRTYIRSLCTLCVT